MKGPRAVGAAEEEVDVDVLMALRLPALVQSVSVHLWGEGKGEGHQSTGRVVFATK